MGHTRNARLIVEALRARPDVEVLLEVGSELFDTADATLAIRAWNTVVRWDMLRAADVMVNWFGRMFVLPVSEAIATPMLLRRLAELDVDILVGTSDLWNRALGTHARRIGLPFFILPVPLVREGRIAAYLAGNHATPGAWTTEEIALTEETAERTWGAVERARAEAALHASEEKYRALFETMGQGYCDLELLRDAEGRAVDQRY